MVNNDKAILKRVIEKEGFDYAMVSYSNYDGAIEFNHIKDEKFHKLKSAMLAARAELVEYCQECVGTDM